jgi:hypothetical protein
MKAPVATESLGLPVRPGRVWVDTFKQIGAYVPIWLQ